MARAAGVATGQLRALGRLKALPGIGSFYLAGGTAIAFHLGHRRSDDLDLFGPADASFSPFQGMARRDSASVQVVKVGEATLRMEIDSIPVDVVRYPYPLLRKAAPGPSGFPVAGLLDLATNKLAAISKRGLKRDFWDLYAIARSGISLAGACKAYVQRFGVAEADMYHVMLALTWFDDAEAETVPPRGLTRKLWAEIRAHFEAEAPALVLGPKPRRR